MTAQKPIDQERVLRRGKTALLILKHQLPLSSWPKGQVEITSRGVSCTTNFPGEQASHTSAVTTEKFDLSDALDDLVSHLVSLGPMR